MKYRPCTQEQDGYVPLGAEQVLAATDGGDNLYHLKLSAAKHSNQMKLVYRLNRHKQDKNEFWERFRNSSPDGV